MNGLRWFGLIVLVLGILGLIYGGFSYTEETHDADLGPIQVEIEDKEHVNVPVWAGVAATVVGGALLAFGGGKRP
jgi:drug/metabolite transporter (DMT)-like permease